MIWTEQGAAALCGANKITIWAWGWLVLVWPWRPKYCKFVVILCCMDPLNHNLASCLDLFLSSMVLLVVGLTDASGTARLVASVASPLRVAFWGFWGSALCFFESDTDATSRAWLVASVGPAQDGQKGHPKAQ